MRPESLITSVSNPRLKAVTALRRRRIRDEQRRTVVEGYDELTLALSAGARLETLFHCPELMTDPRLGAELVTAAATAGAEIIELGRTAYEKIAYREGADGLLAVARAVAADLGALRTGAAPLLLLAQSVEKPGNLGAMLRTADAAGVDAVIAADAVGDWGNPNVVRASKGTVYAVPVASAGTAAVLGWLAERGVALVATTPDTEEDYTDVDYTGPVAIAVGAEKTGLTEALLAAADHRVRIPMSGRANSLNVATSAAVVLYEAVRQRRAALSGLT